MKKSIQIQKLGGTILCSLALVIAITGCGGGKKPSEKVQTEETKVVDVKTEIVSLQTVEQVEEYTGTISAYSKNMIASQSAMRIEKILVEVGDDVKVGQLLVQMEETNYLQSKLQVENLRTDFARMQSLFKTGGVSKQQLDQLKTQLDVAEETMANLEKNARLLSPISGVVTQRFFDNGDMTGGQPILQVQQLRPVKISINVQEEYFPVVQAKMSASVKMDIYPETEFAGKVSLIYPTIDAVTHSFITEIVSDNQSRKMRPGMFARVVLNFGKAQRVVVSDKAVIKQQGTDARYAYVLNSDNTVTYTKIKLGKRRGNAYEILSGLNNGDKVVTAGISRLINGVAVREVNDPSATVVEQ